jgi:hypothetical protein
MILRDDVNTYNSLYHLSLRWARADSNNFLYSDFIQSLNMAVNRLTAIIHSNDGGWPWHDTNSNGDLVDTSLNLTANQSEYPLALPWLKIAQIRIKLNDGVTWHSLTFKSNDVVTDFERISPNIQHYYLLGTKLFLVGVPEYTQNNGIEITYQTGATHFTTAVGDYTKTVGYNPNFEELSALMPALDYLEINGPDEQARKVEKRIGIEPRAGVEGSGLLNSLAVSYQERNDVMQTISLSRSNRAIGLTDIYSGNNPMY